MKVAISRKKNFDSFISLNRCSLRLLSRKSMATHQLIQLQQFSTCALVGVIWLVQCLVYPTFKLIPTPFWPEYHRHHTRSISYVVVPLMLVELGVGVALLIQMPHTQIMQALLLAAVWISTFAIQVPLHQRLSTSRDAKAIDLLIKTNWIRTAAWTVKALASLAAFPNP
jgi:hypothetical protein